MSNEPQLIEKKTQINVGLSADGTKIYISICSQDGKIMYMTYMDAASADTIGNGLIQCAKMLRREIPLPLPLLPTGIGGKQ